MEGSSQDEHDWDCAQTNPQVDLYYSDMLGGGESNFDFASQDHNHTDPSFADFYPEWGIPEWGIPEWGNERPSSVTGALFNEYLISGPESSVEHSPSQLPNVNLTPPTAQASPPFDSVPYPSSQEQATLSAIKPHTCTDCGKSYKTKNNLQRHRRDSVHGPATPSPLFPLASHYSPGSLGGSPIMIPIMVNKKMYDCPQDNCGRKGENGFPRKDNMVQHQRLVHGAQIKKRERRNGDSTPITKARKKS